MNQERMIELAQGQLDAYNARDLEKFCSFYHPKIQVYRMATNTLTCDNIDTFREMYRSRFSDNPDLHCELRSRVVLADSVLDEEWVTGAGTPSHVVAIYNFEDNLISKVWFAR